MTNAGGYKAVRNPQADAVCGDRHEFPRDPFAGVGRAIVFCEKPKGHSGGHAGVKRSTAFEWQAASQ